MASCFRKISKQMASSSSRSTTAANSLLAELPFAGAFLLALLRTFLLTLVLHVLKRARVTVSASSTLIVLADLGCCRSCCRRFLTAMKESTFLTMPAGAFGKELAFSSLSCAFVLGLLLVIRALARFARRGCGRRIG